MHMELIKGNVRVELEALGEGWDGEYNPDDPDDESLLRFTVSKLVDGEWTEVPNASYCTRISEDVSVESKRRALATIMAEVWDTVEHDGPGVKLICQNLSWILV